MRRDISDALLAKEWRPQPEGQDAQPKWCGLTKEELAARSRYEHPEFEHVEGL